MTSLALLPGMRTTPEFLENFTSVVNAAQNPVIYLTADPGEANGICGYDDRMYLVFMFTVHHDDMVDFLNCFKKVKQFVAEDYRIFPHKAKDHVYSKVITLRILGWIEGWCKMNKVKLALQGSHIKQNAYNWIGRKPPSKTNPLRHMEDANAHFWFWAIDNQKADLNRVMQLGNNG